MSSPDVPLSGASPPSVPPQPVLRWLSTSNPFYVISAALFLAGLKVSFGAQAREIDSWALMGGLAGYTLLLALAALILVRFARVWNDVRTVLLLVVLMFLATSVTFDELLVLNPGRGRWFCAAGLLFAVLTTEAILRAIRLKLSAWVRVPYHLTLALFFLYPVLLVSVMRAPNSDALLWGLWGFAPAAGLIFLTLIPAIRRGRALVQNNGSPWPWPFYPWSLFVFLAVAVCGRAFLLCWSFHLVPNTSEHLVYGPYFLVPFGFALAVLVLEFGIVERSRVTQFVALAAPAGLVLLAAVGHRPDAIYTDFLNRFATVFGGTPLFAALVASCAFYLYSWARGLRFAPDGLTAALGALACVRPGALELVDATAPHPALLAVAAALAVWVMVWRANWWRRAAGAAVALAWGGALAWRFYRALREEVPGLDYLVLGLLLLPVAVAVSLQKSGALRRWRQNAPARSGET